MLPIDYARLTVQDALDLAVLIEEEARERYEDLARMVGGRYAGDAADMFRTMAVYEERHGEDLAARRRQLFGTAPSRVTRDMLFEVEAPDLGRPRVFMSARQALEVAQDSEEKAHAFFTAALAHVTDSGVRALFAELAEEELHHRTMVHDKLVHLPEGPDVEEDEADQPGSDPGN